MNDMRECSRPGCKRVATHILDLEDYCDQCYARALDALPDEEDEMMEEKQKTAVESAVPRLCQSEKGCERPATLELDGKKFCRWHYVAELKRKRRIYQLPDAPKRGRPRRSNKKSDKSYLSGVRVAGEIIRQADPACLQTGGYRLLITRAADNGVSETMFSTGISHQQALDIIINAMKQGGF